MCDTPITSKTKRFKEPSKSDSYIVGLFSNKQSKNILAELIKCKTKIKSKRCRIQKLKKTLSCACIVTKTLASAKKESRSLKQHLNHAQRECADLFEKYRSNVKIINSLSRENMMLRNMLENLENFVQLGYKELQKIRFEDPEETSVLAQLRQLIVSNGEFYSNYCNEHEKYEQLKQRNRFLTNKNSILEYNVQSVSEQIKSFEYHALRMQKESESKNRCLKSKSFENVDPQFTISEVNLKSKAETSTGICALNINRTESGGSQHLFSSERELSTHLIIVKNLLNDQDALLRDLQVLSQECLKKIIN